MNLPEQDSHAILGRLREGTDGVTTILQGDDGDLLLQVASALKTRPCEGQDVENLSDWLRGALPSGGGGLSVVATLDSHNANLSDASASKSAGGTSAAASCPLSLGPGNATSSNPDPKVMWYFGYGLDCINPISHWMKNQAQRRHLVYISRALPDSQKRSKSYCPKEGMSIDMAAAMTTLSKQPHMEVTKRLYNYCWTREQTLTQRAATLAPLSKPPHMEAMKGLCGCC
ncbi:hypothetical protein FOVG_18337 [Fusarium oxysporum f. sp. pisi HDV247]|uniref:Uncharacterized protein n=1 Tax=Fusarium oxysporum f. sp. pisi HDV247 TaxID=1080344 RepID=W9NC62_FUSOX|nr:hypothetical protein FOVG_18337 [Fusarium oxysporum f. sp. pisi HDV247]